MTTFYDLKATVSNTFLLQTCFILCFILANIKFILNLKTASTSVFYGVIS